MKNEKSDSFCFKSVNSKQLGGFNIVANQNVVLRTDGYVSVFMS